VHLPAAAGATAEAGSEHVPIERQLTARRADARLTAELMQVTAEDRAALLPSGSQPLFTNRVAWAVTHLAQAGLLDRPARGVTQITVRGQEVLGQCPDRVDFANVVAYRRDPPPRLVVTVAADGYKPTTVQIPVRLLDDDDYRAYQNERSAKFRADLQASQSTPSPVCWSLLSGCGAVKPSGSLGQMSTSTLLRSASAGSSSGRVTRSVTARRKRRARLLCSRCQISARLRSSCVPNARPTTGNGLWMPG
jgi:hypothetical protein